jgi:hypothetical protein
VTGVCKGFSEEWGLPLSGTDLLQLHEQKYEFMIVTIYLLTATGLSPGGGTHLHTNNT